ncbi:MAG: antiviral protein [Cyanobacteriota bacterium]
MTFLDDPVKTLTYTSPADLFAFPLDDFQRQAIAALDHDQSVVVCAPTGSGKTVIGEYAIYRAIARGKRVFYTTPLKALSNQKVRDFQEKLETLGVDNADRLVGLITGDTVINANAPVVVMTTEIFRNMLYETPIGEVGTSLENVETVVFDEVHYISDRSRGTVWEESIIYCPSTIQIVGLSATIGNPEQLTEWINQVRTGVSLKVLRQTDSNPDSASCVLVNSDFRPVPLNFHYSTRKGLFPLLNAKHNGVNPRLLPKEGNKNTRSGKNRRLRKEDCPSVFTVMRQLQERDLLPVIYVIFSRRGCEQSAQALADFCLVEPTEQESIQLQLLNFFFGKNPQLRDKLNRELKQGYPDLVAAVLGYLDDPAMETTALLNRLAIAPDDMLKLWQWIAQSSPMTRFEQIEPLLRGIAVHHAGVLPDMKTLVEKLFEQGLVKVVFATATLAAGINMPARTTVISALSKRTSEGHAMLSPSEFLQIAGRAGRRGMDAEGHVVTVQTPFEGAPEGAYLALAAAEPLRSWFTPSYGMVLNLLQKHSLEEAKNLLERSFAEYLAQFALEPTKAAITDAVKTLAQLDIKLAGIEERDLHSYEKFRGRLREEERLLKTLQQQAEKSRKQDLKHQLTHLKPGHLLYLKGRHIKGSKPRLAVIITLLPAGHNLPQWCCLGDDNRWYQVSVSDVFDVPIGDLPTLAWQTLTPPPAELLAPTKPIKGDEVSAAIANGLDPDNYPLLPAPEVMGQQARVDHVRTLLDVHPLTQQKHPGKLVDQFHQRQALRKTLAKRQQEYDRLQSRQSYYWQEFLDLIDILQHMDALEEFTPTLLGETAATLRGENELWLGLTLISGKFNDLSPEQLAAAVSALITETPRSDTWTHLQPSPQVLAALRPSQDLALWQMMLKVPSLPQAVWQALVIADELNRVNLWDLRRKLIKSQNAKAIAIPLWLEVDLMGLVEQWATGMDWETLCQQTSLDEGDLVRLFRRTVDLLWQIPQVPHLSPRLKRNARLAVSQMKRFPL